MEEATDLGSPEPIKLPYTIGGKKYILREADEGAQAKFQSLAAKGATLSPDGRISVGTHLGELEPFLVSQCLWECNSDTGEPLRLVPDSVIRGWSGRVVKPLFERAQEISGMKTKEPPERRALLAALGQVTELYGPDAIGQFRSLVKELLDADPKLYGPLWALVEPKEEFDPKK